MKDHGERSLQRWHILGDFSWLDPKHVGNRFLVPYNCIRRQKTLPFFRYSLGNETTYPHLKLGGGYVYELHWFTRCAPPLNPKPNFRNLGIKDCHLFLVGKKKSPAAQNVRVGVGLKNIYFILRSSLNAPERVVWVVRPLLKP